jgi:hypothetical protein
MDESERKTDENGQKQTKTYENKRKPNLSNKFGIE